MGLAGGGGGGMGGGGGGIGVGGGGEEEGMVFKRDGTRGLGLGCLIELVGNLPEKSAHFHLLRAKRERFRDVNCDFLVFLVEEVVGVAYSATLSSSYQMQIQVFVYLCVYYLYYYYVYYLELSLNM